MGNDEFETHAACHGIRDIFHSHSPGVFQRRLVEFRRHRRLQRAENPFYPFFHIIPVHIAHHGHCSPVESVPRIMEIPQYLRSDPVYILFRTERDTLAIASSTYLQIIKLVPDIISAQFLLDHALLFLHFLPGNSDVSEPVFQYQQRTIQILRIIGRHGKHIDGPVVAGEGIDAYPVLDSQRLQILHQFPFREMACPSESHVLQKMRRPPVPVRLHHRSRPENQTELYHPRRRLVLHYDIVQAVGQSVRHYSCRRQYRLFPCLPVRAAVK